MYKAYMRRLFERAHSQNTDNIAHLARSYGIRFDSACDVGAGDGNITTRIFSQLDLREAHVVESYAPNAAELRERGFVVHEDDLNRPTSIPDASFDLVVSNQVIEHLYDTDVFIEDIYRILRPGGVAVISTENLASWHNIFALILGWQPFSLTNITAKRGGIGNPLALFSGCDGNCFPMQHHRLVTKRALEELLRVHGFTDIRSAGSGYHPLPAVIGTLEKAHAHFIATSGRKPGSI